MLTKSNAKFNTYVKFYTLNINFFFIITILMLQEIVGQHCQKHYFDF